MSSVVDRLILRFGRERWNEHLKLAATALNGLAIACLVGAFVAPFVNATPPRIAALFLLSLFGLFLHMAAQIVVGYYRGKD